MKQLCFFEDEAWKSFQPLTLTRPVDELRIGILKIHQKWENYLNPEVSTRIIRKELSKLFDHPFPRQDSDCIWINGRYVPDASLMSDIDQLQAGEGLTFEDVPVIMKISGSKTTDLFENPSGDFEFIDFHSTKKGRLLRRVTDLFTFNGEQIARDCELLDLKPDNLADREGVTVFGDHPVYVNGDITIEPGTTLNTSGGPIFIDNQVTILSGTQIRGPVALCKHAVLKMSAKIYKDTTIGPFCKVGGELNNVVFQGYSNKAHDGFLGNSVIGEWCNFGADTNNSNLKNNYSKVRLTDWSTREQYDTGLQFCGTIMGDHCKTAINSNLNTGSVFGVCCNIVTRQFPPKYLPSFSWLTDKENQVYDLDKALETAGLVMKRRNIEITEAYRDLMKYLFESR